MAKSYTFLLLIAVFSFGLSAQTTDAPTGRWYTLDDESGERKSVVEITARGDTYVGKIADILTARKDAVCEKCSGKQKGRPIKGLTIIKGLEKDGEYWSGGTILDPTKGSEYKLSVWYEDGNADVLFVRGKHWTGLYRTQTWTRATD